MKINGQQGSLRTLTDAEIALVSGGEDGSCSAGEGCGTGSAGDPGDSVPTLGTVTVSESVAMGTAAGSTAGLAAAVAGAGGALGVGELIAVGGVVGGALGFLSSIAATGIVAVLNGIPFGLSNVPTTGNPMGDPDPASGP